jgi:polyphosphate glucokinase
MFLKGYLRWMILMVRHSQEKKPFTLAIDMGGTRIKMMVVDAKGLPVTDYLIELTPHPATLEAVCEVISHMTRALNQSYDRIAAGFPGVVQKGIIKTAPNMHLSWIGINLQTKLQDMTGYPARVANDADVQGYGDVSGKGVELVITLGTGVGSALFLNGMLVPNLELGHHPFQDNQTYEQLLGKIALKRLGVEKWNSHLKRAIALWDQTFNYDQLYLGGGYAHKINFKLPDSVKISENIEGVLGGVMLWEL